MNTEETLNYTYRLLSDGKVIREIPIHLDANSLEFISQNDATPPEWAKLSCHQCPNCPFSEDKVPYCPIAVNIVQLVDAFKDLDSYFAIDVEVETPLRNYSVSQTTVQDSLSSMLGIFMTSSGCPIMNNLRPMVRFHLPFPSYEETSYRSLSMYLIVQYIHYKEGKKPDWDLNGFVEMYRDIQKVNHAFNKRLHEILQSDANSNALVILDCFASLIMMDTEIEQIVPDEFRSIFKSLLNDEPPV